MPIRLDNARRLASTLISFVFVAAVLGALWLPVASLIRDAMVLLQHNPRHFGPTLFDALARSLLWNSVALAIGSCGFAFLFGFPVGIALARGPKWFRSIGLVFCALPLALPPTVMTTAYLQWTQTPPALAQTSLGAQTSTSLAPVLIAALILGACFYPIIALVVRATLLGVPREWEDAALSLGSRRELWRKVLWPAIAPVVPGALGVVAALAIWEVGAPDLLGVTTYSMQIRRQLAAADPLDASVANARAALAGLPLFALGALALWPILRARKYFGTAVIARHNEIQSTSEGGFCAALALLVFALCPLAPLLVFVSQLRPRKVLWETWTSNSPEIFNTAVAATFATLLCLVLSLLLIGSWCHKSTLRRVGLALSGALMLVAPVLLGIALIGFYNRPGWEWIYGGGEDDGTWRATLMDWSSRYTLLVLGYLSRFLPLAVWWLDDAVARTDTVLLDAAHNLGATPGRAARTILLPHLIPAIIGSGAVLWALCAGELATSILVNAPGGQTLPVPIFNWMHIGAIEQVAALSLALFGLNAFVIGAAQILMSAPDAIRDWRLRRSEN